MNTLSIEPASSDDLKSCFDLERFYDVRADRPEEQGFFLPGVQESLYQDMYETGLILVIKDSAGVRSFAMVLPPGHRLINNLFADPKSMLLFADQKPDQLFWIAKIATRPDCRRQGHAADLYRHILNQFAGIPGMTATALGPVRNRVSEGFHRALGFEPCGVFLGGTKGHLENTVSTVWIV